VICFSTLLLITVATLSIGSFAQSFRGAIRGKVQDPNGNLIAGAKITAKSSATGLTRDTVTGSDGTYVIAELPAGIYGVSAQSAGLTPVSQNVLVNVGLDTTADFDLALIQKRQEQLTVTATAPLVEQNRDVLGEVVDQRLVNELPLNGRDFGKLVALVQARRLSLLGWPELNSASDNSTSTGTATALTTTRSTAPTTTIPSSTIQP
jgi:hypothetical protein